MSECSAFSVLAELIEVMLSVVLSVDSAAKQVENG